MKGIFTSVSSLILTQALTCSCWAFSTGLPTLVEKARETHTDYMAVYKDGQLLVKYQSDYRPERFAAMSVSKSFMSLAIGFLMDEGKIKSLDTPVATFYPEWNQGHKKEVTLKHILSHTSGLQNDESTSEIGDAADVVQLALAAELTDAPGTRFQYNSKAINLLCGIVHKLTGMTADQYLNQKLFTPLGLTNWSWQKDPSGNPIGNGGLSIGPEDLARVGIWLLNDGVWEGQRLLSHKWIQGLFFPSQQFDPTCSLLWWLVNEANSKDVFTTPAHAIVAAGYMGQYLVVSPEQHLVAVRMMDPSSAFGADDPEFKNFKTMVLNLDLDFETQKR